MKTTQLHSAEGYTATQGMGRGLLDSIFTSDSDLLMTSGKSFELRMTQFFHL